ncbi:MAG: hypothetical protein ABJN95_11115 [Maribacter sp.]|uniref:hypothetical protein n=1 Tax=Maribacter sp. TaxID=1897614 RepID=UPI0032997844
MDEAATNKKYDGNFPKICFSADQYSGIELAMSLLIFEGTIGKKKAKNSINKETPIAGNIGFHHKEFLVSLKFFNSILDKFLVVILFNL